MFRTPRLLALCAVLAAVCSLPAAAMLPGSAPPAPGAETEDTAPAWRQDSNRVVTEAAHWKWRLVFVERQGDLLTIGLRYRNGASTGRSIYLATDYKDEVALIDQASGARYGLITTEGITGDIVAVDRKKSKSASFTFPYPDGAEAVTFVSRWVSMAMAGAGRSVTVEVPIALPAE